MFDLRCIKPLFQLCAPQLNP